MREHRTLIAALRKRDVALAQQLMGDHLQALEARSLVDRAEAARPDIVDILGRYSAAFAPADQPPARAVAGARKPRATRERSAKRAGST